MPVVLLAVGPLAQRGGWAAQSAIAIAERLAGTGQRVVLADLSLDNPELHERVGTENTEGLTDVFLFGASVEHVTRMLPAHSFELVPAAPFTPDTEEITVTIDVPMNQNGWLTPRFTKNKSIRAMSRLKTERAGDD